MEISKEQYEKMEEYINVLERNESAKCNTEIQKAQSFHNGYQQAIRDVLRMIKND